MGAWYFVMWLMRKMLFAGTALTLIADILFGIGAALIFSAALIYVDYGRLRLYTLAAAALGMLAFRLGPHNLLIGLGRRLGTGLSAVGTRLRKTSVVRALLK